MGSNQQATDANALAAFQHEPNMALVGKRLALRRQSATAGSARLRLAGSRRWRARSNPGSSGMRIRKTEERPPAQAPIRGSRQSIPRGADGDGEQRALRR